MKQKADLQDLLGGLAELLPREASTATEQRVLSAFRARQKPSARAWTYWGAVAACLALAWFWAYHSREQFQLRPGADSSGSATAGFIALPYAQSDVPLEQAIIVRVRLQPSDWRGLGVTAPPGKASGAINADLLIGQDGVARAVRLVNAP